MALAIARVAAPPGAAFALSAAPGDTAAVTPAAPAPGPRVGEIGVTGNHLTDTDRILRSFGVASGARYSADAVKRGIVKLAGLGLFADVWVEKAEHEDVVDLVIHVRERPRIARVEFSGQRKQEATELEKKLAIHAGEIATPGAVQGGVDSLLKYYHDEGYARVHVEAVLDTTAGPSQVVVRYVIQEGDKVRITRLAFEGASPAMAPRLRQHLKSKKRGFFGGGEVKDENLEEDRQKLEAWYHSQGYRDMRVVGHELRPEGALGHVALVFTIDEGRLYGMGQMSWTGNTVVPTPELAAGLRLRPFDRYDASKIERATGLAYAAYAERGYLSVAIDPRETVRDSIVDVSFAITEGPLSRVRYVTIAGNKSTREKVLRRELAIHEGDRYQLSALRRSRDNLMRLGLFEDVAPDLAPGDSSDVDLVLKVKEKQVGTASAGAGYTGEAGLTGFLELSHNNVLGNAQTLSLHLERGANKSDYFLSFTEPWFRDTPTLLGFSLYNNSLDRDFYRERRRGASGKIGRPLPWPDYSRGAVTYRLEDVTIDEVNLAAARASGASEQTLATIQSGQTRLTSSLAFDFNRNSTNEAFYPTRGTRLIGYSEFTGGPLGGDIRYNKQRLEGRLYLPSGIKGITTMFKARLGFLGQFPDDQQEPPVYERFRLGGGSTLDPLRGYDDYQVVPNRFIHDVAVAFLSDTTIVGTDTTITQVPTRFEKVRYPGGRFFTTYTIEQQFPVVHPVHGVLFLDAGNTWDLLHEIRPFDLKVGAGLGIRLEIPLLGNIGFDVGYGFNRDDGARFKTHFLLGNISY